MSSSCSFRITRTAEDLAQTITALSQRLIKLEQRQDFLDVQLRQLKQEPHPDEIEMLDGVDQMLQDCKDLLNHSIDQSGESSDCISDHEHMAA